MDQLRVSITAGASGIGRSMAETFVADGPLIAGSTARIAEVKLADWQCYAAVSLEGVFLTAKYAAPMMKRKTLIPCDKTLYKQRYKVENMFAKLKDWRRVATRYDRCAHPFFSAVQIVAIVYGIFNKS